MTATATRQYPMPMPFGWFQVAWSDEVAPGDGIPLHYFGRHLVAWRSESGVAHVWTRSAPTWALTSASALASRARRSSARCTAGATTEPDSASTSRIHRA